MIFFDYEGDPAQLPSLTLAYIGDAVYELYIRTWMLERGNIRVQGLHKESVKKVNANHQAKLLGAIEAKLTESELAVARRGRNAKSGHVPKNTEVTVYRRSTGFEALIGYLFLKGDIGRIRELLGED